MPLSAVFLTHNYPRHPGDLAGAFLATLAAALVRRQVGVTVIAPSDGGRGGDEVGADGVRVRRVRYADPANERFAYGGMTAALRSLAGLAALVRMHRALHRAAAREVEQGADVVHAHWWFPAGMATPRSVPVVLTSHGSDAALLARSRLACLVARPVYRRAAVVTAVSSELARWIERGTGRSIAPRHIAPMPVDTDRFTASRGGGGAIVVARLTAQKRVHLAIEGMAELRRRGTALPLTIVGDGPERGALERLAAERSLAGAVRFVGAVQPADVPHYLADADMMIFPARGEGFGLGAAEALLSGVPVVACRDGGGVLDIVPEAGMGRRVEPSPSAIADAAAALLAMPPAADERQAQQAVWRAKLDADTVAAVCEGWYRDALASRVAG